MGRSVSRFFLFPYSGHLLRAMTACLGDASGDGPKAPSKLLHCLDAAERNSALRHRDCRIALNHRERRDRSRNDAASRDHCAFADNNAGQDQSAGADKRVTSDGHTLHLAKMRKHGHPQTQARSHPPGDGERARSIEHHVITNPDILADSDSAFAMQRNSQTGGAGNSPRQLLINPVQKTAKWETLS